MFKRRGRFTKHNTPVNTARRHRQRDYPDAVYELFYASEDRHFWFRARNRIIESCIRRVRGKNVVGSTFLEVGCGTGYVLSMLERMGLRVTGLDMHGKALEFAKRRTKTTLVESRLETFTAAKPLDAIGAFDVIEHVFDEKAFLQTCQTLLSRQGFLYLTVPAGPELWTDIDRISGHKRRYTKSQLGALLEKNGFRVLDIRYFGFFLYVPYYIMKTVVGFLRRRKNLSVTETMKILMKSPPTVINRILSAGFWLEGLVSNVVGLPIGTSLIVAAQKAV